MNTFDMLKKNRMKFDENHQIEVISQLAEKIERKTISKTATFLGCSCFMKYPNDLYEKKFDHSWMFLTQKKNERDKKQMTYWDNGNKNEEKKRTNTWF